MQIIKLSSTLCNEEKETLLNYDFITKTWQMETFVQKHMNKALRQGWTQTKQYIYRDGTVVGGVFTAPEYAITIRNIEKKKMSERQMNNLLDEND